jgi:hypothetical protein
MREARTRGNAWMIRSISAAGVDKAVPASLSALRAR